MPGKTAEVTIRQLAPEQAEEGQERLLYRPVPQLDGPPQFKVSYPWISPAEANEMLREALNADGFRQRKMITAEVRRWRQLINTKRFVHFLPNGVLCSDEDGILLNGQHRLTAVAGQDQSCGFVVFKNVPRWMFAFMDTNKVRTLKDVFFIGARASGPHTPSAMRLGMRYEEFLFGLRSSLGWRHWMTTRDEHQDVDGFLARRGEFQDWYGVGEKVHSAVKLLVPSAMAFRFYQTLAWPDGDPEIQEFTESLASGTMLPPKSPVAVLREWARECYYNKDKIFAKREAHLMLLMRCFAQVQAGTRLDRLTWAYGQPMAMPYHPQGHEVAVKNVRQALEDLDTEYAE